jgi:intracellular sulfur oxidation DsrE/DsrF family protein
MKQEKPTPRRNFLTTFFGSAATLALASIAAPFKTQAENISTDKKDRVSEALFKNLDGKHKIVFDTTAFRSGAVLAWTSAFLNSNNETGTIDAELNAVIIFRSLATGMSLNDAMWEKYQLGEIYKIDDPLTKAPAIKNLFVNVKSDEFIDQDNSLDVLQNRGVLFCVCKIALEGNAEHIAEKRGLKKDDVHKDLLANLLKDLYIMPSGVWALGRAQERGCAYVSAG